MAIPRLLPALLLAALPAVAQEPPLLGTAALVGEAPLYLLPKGTGAEGAPVTLILPDPASGDVVIRAATLGAPADIDLEGLTAYSVGGSVAAGVGFLLLGPMPEIAVTGGALRVDVTGDGVPETLTSCLTMEAVQLRATADDGTEVWSDYVPLGYDVEATCP